MEGKKSIVEDLFPRRDAATPAKSDILSTIFPPHAPPAASRKPGADGQNSNVQSATAGNQKAKPSTRAKMNFPDVKSQGSPGQSQSIPKKRNNPIFPCEIAEPCLMSSSVHYGSRDDFFSEPSFKPSSGSAYQYKKDQKDVSGNTDIASRGDWWQGSYYY